MDNPYLSLVPSKKGSDTPTAEVDTSPPPASPNPYASLVPPKQNNSSTSSGASSPVPDEGSFMAGVENFNRVFGRLAEGGIDLVGKAIGSQSLQDNIAKVNTNKNAEAALSAQQHPVAAGIGTGLGIAGTIPYAALLSGGVGAVANGAVANGAITGGLLGAGNYSASNTDRLLNGVAGAALGAAIPAVASQVKGYLSPGDDLSNSLSKVIGGKSAAAQDVSVVNAPKQQLQQTVDNLVPGGKNAISDAQATQYGALNNAQASDSAMASLQANPSISARLSGLNNDVDSLVNKLPDNSLGKLDALKQNIDSELFKDNHALDIGLKPLQPSQAAALQKARGDIIDTINSEASAQGIDYQGLRQMGEKKALYNDITSLLNSKPDMKGATPTFDPTQSVQNKSIESLYNVLAGTPNKATAFVNSIESAGGDGQNAKDLISKLASLRNNPVDAAVAKAGASAGSTAHTGFHPIETLQHDILNGSYNDEVVKLALSGPSMQEKLSEALSSSSTKNLLSKLSPLLDVMKNTSIGKLLGSDSGEELSKGVAPALAGYLSQNQYAGATAGMAIEKGSHVIGHLTGLGH